MGKGLRSVRLPRDSVWLAEVPRHTVLPLTLTRDRHRRSTRHLRVHELPARVQRRLDVRVPLDLAVVAHVPFEPTWSAVHDGKRASVPEVHGPVEGQSGEASISFFMASRHLRWAFRNAKSTIDTMGVTKNDLGTSE